MSKCATIKNSTDPRNCDPDPKPRQRPHGRGSHLTFLTGMLPRLLPAGALRVAGGGGVD